MGLFFVSKLKHKLLMDQYEMVIEKRDYWKEQAQNAIAEKNEALSVRNELIKDRDFYKQLNERNYQKYRKVLSSNGGYGSANKKLKEKVDRYEKILGVNKTDEVSHNIVFGVDLAIGNDVHYEPKNLKDNKKSRLTNFIFDEIGLREERHNYSHQSKNNKRKANKKDK